MTEKEFEQILIKNPELIEEGIIFKANQINLEGKRLDLLFEDKNGQYLVIEVKLTAKRKDIAQLMEYSGYFIDKEKKPIRAMLVALRIPIYYRKSFDYWGVEYKEIQESELLKVEPNINKNELLEQLTPIIYGSALQNNKPQEENVINEQSTLQSNRNLTRQNMATRLKGRQLFNQARYAIDYLTKASSPVFMKDFVPYMKSINYKSKSYYDLFNALCDSGLVTSTIINGRKAYSLAND